MSLDQIQPLLDSTIIEFETTFDKKRALLKKESRAVRKLTPFQTYIALVKGYCCLVVLLVPKSFTWGGYVISSLAFLASGLLSGICVVKLVQVGLKLKCFSYSLCVNRVLGPNGRMFLDVMIFCTQMAFTISQISFVVTSAKSTLDFFSGTDVSLALISFATVVVFTPLALVRDISRFSFTFLLGNLLILTTVLYTLWCCLSLLSEQTEPAPGFVAVDWSHSLQILGFAIYSYEGIGTVMPILQCTKKPEKFIFLVSAAILTLTVLYIGFGFICYKTFGSGLDKPIITEMLPIGVTITAIKMAFSLNLLCGYPIQITPALMILEHWIWGSRKDKKLLKNLMRVIVVASSVVVAVALASELDKFLGLLGAVCCAPLALLLPSILHLKTLATSNRQKLVDATLIIIALGILIFCTVQSISNWNEKTH